MKDKKTGCLALGTELRRMTVCWRQRQESHLVRNSSSFFYTADKQGIDREQFSRLALMKSGIQTARQLLIQFKEKVDEYLRIRSIFDTEIAKVRPQDVRRAVKRDLFSGYLE